MIKMRYIILGIVFLAGLYIVPLLLKSDADIASSNLSKAADFFQIDRRIVFYNGITGEYMLSVEGKCSIADQGTQLEVTCKTGPKEFKKHFLGLSDNVTYFAEQVDGANISSDHYKVVFKPTAIIPDIDLNKPEDTSI
jgi:hypothetical protein